MDDREPDRSSKRDYQSRERSRLQDTALETEQRFAAMEEALRKHSYAIWGLQGNNGMVAELRALRTAFEARNVADAERREQEYKDRRRTYLTVALALFAAFISALGTLVGVLVG